MSNEAGLLDDVDHIDGAPVPVAKAGAAAGLRVLHCPWNVGCNPASLAHFERRLGLVSHCVTLTQDPFGFHADEVLFEPGIDVFEQARRRTNLLRLAMAEFDVIHLNFGQTIVEQTGWPKLPRRPGPLALHWNLYGRHLRYHLLWRVELPLLRALNKVVVMTYQGDDARQGDYCRDHFQISPAETADYYSAESDERKRRAIRRVARYADRIYCLNPDLLHVLPKQAVFVPYASVDPVDWNVTPAAADGLPIVLHAPTNRTAKGTQFIIDAVEQLQREGVRFEFVLVENLKREDARRLYERAHVIIDQLLVGWYGGFAVEVMAMGKPVICYIRQEDLAFVPAEMARDLPIVDATPATIKDVLRNLLIGPRGELAEIGLRSRQFVKKWHDPWAIAAQVAGDYAALAARKQTSGRRLAAAAISRATSRFRVIPPEPVVTLPVQLPTPVPQRPTSRTICVLALSAIADDPRVRRQADAFHAAGWDVVAVGLPGGRSPPPVWPVLTRDDLPPPEPPPSGLDDLSEAATAAAAEVAAEPSSKSRLLHLFREAHRFVPVSERNWARLEYRLKRLWSVGEQVLRLGRSTAHTLIRRPTRIGGKLASQLSSEAAEHTYWNMSRDITDLLACARQVDASIWLANDWTMLPIAARLAGEKGGHYVYDSHEFATEEYAERLSWRLLQRPFVHAIEGQFVRNAAVVSAVSAGIAESLDKLYQLPRASLVIRNMPAFEEVSFRPTAHDRIRVLYHGIVAPNRGLEAAIDSVAAWRREYDLTIRGPGEAAYLEELQARIQRQGLDSRACLAPPVPMTALVREAAHFDVGFFALPGHSNHNQFALPNKFFEYTMAGLALCVTDLPEMARLIREYDLGVTFSEVEPTGIAEVLNALQPELIDRYKRNALSAARELCWNRESERLVGAYSAVLQKSACTG